MHTIIIIVILFADFITLFIDFSNMIHYGKEYEKSHRDSDLLKSITSFVWTLIMILCIILMCFNFNKIKNNDRTAEVNYTQKII